ncbi:protein SGT1 homolog A isoform X1 [Brassica rapa]|uniref:protein SGT1 homolog A isoform X1 n=2 Tax=Brassica campestris TaxID=3711 RepID=UPI00142D4553|nr:protein SGT1 homolog A isoform X1 [Brassica rapa]
MYVFILCYRFIVTFKVRDLIPFFVYIVCRTACMKLEEYQTAKNALQKGASIAPSESKFKKLIDECDLRISEEEKILVQPVASPSVKADLTHVSSAPAKPKFRHDYYQKPEEVVVTIFAKGIPKQNVNIDFGEQVLSVVIDVPGEEEAYHLQPRLFGKIVPEKCRYEVLSTKVEIRLAKAEIITWASLEHAKVPAVLPKPNVLSEVSVRPAYPSSKKVKDWDKLEAEVKKQDNDEKLEGDAALDKSLREMYSNADEDMRRAMSKSFVSIYLLFGLSLLMEFLMMVFGQMNRWNQMGLYCRQTGKRLGLRQSRALLRMVWSSRNGRSNLPHGPFSSCNEDPKVSLLLSSMAFSSQLF